jgi:pimeloyl-ACP methyl ester carboxylesterase
MPYAPSNGVRLYYEEAGKGNAIVFVHEFSGDLRTWEAQMRFFSRRFRCIAFNARGYPPSDVPTAVSKYSYTIAVDDIANVMRHLGVAKAHIIGCSMGAYATLQFGLRYPRRARSLTAIGAGAGSDPAAHRKFIKASLTTARQFEEEGLAPAMKRYRTAANRIQLELKDPRGFREFFVRFAPSAALQLRAPVRAHDGADPHGGRRRGRNGDRVGALREARVPGSAHDHGARHRSPGQCRGAGVLQPRYRGLSRAGGQRAVAPARPPRADH